MFPRHISNSVEGRSVSAWRGNNYLVWSILVTLFCCLPFGIVAIVKSSQVNGLWAQGRYAEAQASADSAKKWVIWSAVIGVVVGIIYGILMAVGALNTNTNAALAAMF
ncbi:CD225/dispanin family protein [Mycobacterium avium]|uniref:CD225/dispanin family protein n=1 Tax=Mycobacterium avium TaxID=1764 RepID=UPI0012DA4604